MERLLDKLIENRESGIYPYHMPGHKRRPCGGLGHEIFGIDITEIDGFDNLHQPQGILARLQERAARLYGAEESYYLVNGSTAGILSAISAALPRGGHLLMARNCHKSAYHGAYLRGLELTGLFPPVLEGYSCFDAITPGQVWNALDADPGIQAVLLVSPTYEGRISDIRGIAEIVHEKGIPLIVDEAHGAHLGLAGEKPENSCQAGADLVIHSVHKTLPALTQTALLHVNGSRIDRERLRRFLRIYQTSSPSYPLMASIDNALCFMEEQGKGAFRRFEEGYGKMLKELESCRRLCFLPWEKGVQDVGKLVISVGDTGLTGRELYDILLRDYRLQLEMAGDNYVLAMFTINDGPEAYERMSRALLEIDRAQPQGKRPQSADRAGWFSEGLAAPGISLAEAWDMETEEAELSCCVGRIGGEFVNLYPPGVPVLVPGERMTSALCEKIQGWMDQGLTVQGVERRGDRIVGKVLKNVQGYGADRG